jgi:hypothetical protein
MRVHVRAPARPTVSGSYRDGDRARWTPVMLRANVSNGSSPAMLGPVRDAPVARRMRIIDGELRWAKAWAEQASVVVSDSRSRGRGLSGKENGVLTWCVASRGSDVRAVAEESLHQVSARVVSIAGGGEGCAALGVETVDGK